MKPKKTYNKSLSNLAKRTKRRRNFRIFVIIAIPTLLLLGIIYLMNLPSLQVSFIEVEGAESISVDSIKEKVNKIISGKYIYLFPKSNVFIVNERELAAALSHDFPRIKKIDINKNANGVLEIALEERNASGLWCNSTCFLLDPTGLVFSKADENEIESKIIFRGVIAGDPLMKQFTDKETLARYFEMIEEFDKRGVKLSSVYIESEDRAIIESSLGNIIFTPDSLKLKEMVDNTLVIINDVRKSDPEAIFEYIDTRFGNKFFYKIK